MTITTKNIKELAESCKVYSDCPIADKQGKFRMLMTSVRFRLSDGRYLRIESGFTWDENSIPFLLQFFFPKSGIYAVPAMIHDALYYLTEPSQAFADKEFKHWMEAMEINKRQVLFRYYAVRIFGTRWWGKNKRMPSKRCQENRKLIQLF